MTKEADAKILKYFSEIDAVHRRYDREINSHYQKIRQLKFKRYAEIKEIKKRWYLGNSDLFFGPDPVTIRYKAPPGERLRILIRAKGFSSISKFAKHISLDRSRVSQIINGLGAKPSLDLKIRISKALDVDSRTIWYDEEEDND